jgi:adenylate kinase family enzyme
MTDGRGMVTHSELAGILADHDSPEAETAWANTEESVHRWKIELAEMERGWSSLPQSRFDRLARIFGLAREELDLLRLCAAVALDPALARACAYIQDHSGRPYLTEELAARLLGLGRAGVWAPEMAVFRWDLVNRRDGGPGEPAALMCDPQIKDWLRGRNAIDSLLAGSVRVSGPNDKPLPEWPVYEVADWAAQSLRQGQSAPVRIIVAAPHGGGKRNFAAAVAERIGLPMLAVENDAPEELLWPKFFQRMQRQAFLDGVAPAWTHEAVGRRPWPAVPTWFPLQFILCEPGTEPPPVTGIVDRKIDLPMPEAPTRERLWRESTADAARWPKDELRTLAERHRVWPGDIERAIQLGARTPGVAARIVRETARHRFGNLAQILECPFRPDDLVLPSGVKHTLDAIAFEAEERGTFWQDTEPRRLFPQGRGLIALFSGPPGTGKTMAAQVIAARLGQDLCRVNVAQLVSKWVGETPKNCEQVIRVAAENNAVLFFDEADALFARRSTEIRDAQDKFANTDTAFLLQAIENYPGVAFLASNLKSNIDPAFVRRLRYVVEFPKPDAALQHALWTKLVAALAGAERAKALAPAIELLSASVETTGSQIKFAVLGGLFAARADGQPLSVRHLLTGLDRELGKEGRGFGPRERERVLKLEPAK